MLPKHLLPSKDHGVPTEYSLQILYCSTKFNSAHLGQFILPSLDICSHLTHMFLRMHLKREIWHLCMYHLERNEVMHWYLMCNVQLIEALALIIIITPVPAFSPANRGLAKSFPNCSMELVWPFPSAWTSPMFICGIVIELSVQLSLNDRILLWKKWVWKSPALVLTAKRLVVSQFIVQAQRETAWVQTPALQLASCVTLSRQVT